MIPTTLRVCRCRPAQPAGAGRRGGDGGQVTAFVAVFTLALLLMAGLVLDGGLGLAGKVRAIDEAQEAGRAAAQQLDLGLFRTQGVVVLDPDRARTAALAYLTNTGDTGSVTVTGDEVSVRVVHRQATQLLQLIGVRQLTVTGTATVHARHGIGTEEGGVP